MPEDLEGPQKMPRMFGGLTVRSVALGVILTLILSWAVPYNKLYIKDPGLEAGFLPAIAVFVVAMLSLAINPLLKKKPRFADLIQKVIDLLFDSKLMFQYS